MMGINSAVTTEVMPGRQGVELVQRQHLLAYDNTNVCKINRRNNCAAAAAHGTVTATRINNAVGQMQFKHH